MGCIRIVLENCDETLEVSPSQSYWTLIQHLNENNAANQEMAHMG